MIVQVKMVKVIFNATKLTQYIGHVICHVSKRHFRNLFVYFV